ncbi:MAG: hypothetical protein AB3N14_18625, partial [Flavobacteriaceae bacterium]
RLSSSLKDDGNGNYVMADVLKSADITVELARDTYDVYEDGSEILVDTETDSMTMPGGSYRDGSVNIYGTKIEAFYDEYAVAIEDAFGGGYWVWYPYAEEEIEDGDFYAYISMDRVKVDTIQDGFDLLTSKGINVIEQIGSFYDDHRFYSYTMTAP